MDIQYIFKRSSCGVSESVSTDLSINNFIGAHLERHIAVHFFFSHTSYETSALSQSVPHFSPD